MTTIGRTGTQRTHGSLSDHRRTQDERNQMLALLDKAVSRPAARNTPAVSLERETYYCVRTPDGRPIGDFQVEGDERDVVRNLSGFAIDRERGEFYFSQWGETHGPLKLPRGFEYACLFPNTQRDPAARSDGHKALKSLVKAIREQEPEVYGKPFVHMDYDSDGGTWRTPDGGKLHKATPYDKRYSYGSQSFMFDLRKKEFWLEQIPGYSGECYGPFKLPAGFGRSQIAALDKLDASRPAPARSRDSYNSPSGRSNRSWVIGGANSGFYPSAGGGGSGTSPSSVYWRYRGGGGGGS